MVTGSKASPLVEHHDGRLEIIDRSSEALVPQSATAEPAVQLPLPVVEQ